MVLIYIGSFLFLNRNQHFDTIFNLFYKSICICLYGNTFTFSAHFAYRFGGIIYSLLGFRKQPLYLP
jgi:hypothetical protein